MKFKRPTHATVVAYLALFAALGGTAIAARDNIGAREIKQLEVRKDRFTPTAQGGLATVVARCRSNEQFISGGGGWARENSAAPAPTISEATAVRSRANLDGFLVTGRAPGLDNTLVARAYCLPR